MLFYFCYNLNINSTLYSIYIASMAPLPMAFGCIIGGYFIEKFGRKSTQIIINVPFLIGWLFIYFANNLIFILIGRFLTGLSVGVIGPANSVYLGEISAPKLRGLFLGAVSFAISMGILLVHVIGTYVNWKNTALICGIFPLLSFLMMCFLPESPSWLIKRGKITESLKAFEWLRGHSEVTKCEYNNIVNNTTTTKIVNKKMTKNMCDSSFTKPLLIILGFFFIMQFAGINIIVFYCVTLMQLTLDKNINEYTAMWIIDIVRVVASVIACILIKKVGRRLLALISSLGTAISLIALSAILYYDLTEFYQYDFIKWLPFITLISYISFVSIGLVPLPWCMIGELFPLHSRGIGSGAATAFNFLCFFIVIKTGPSLFEQIGTEGVFLIYGIIAFIGSIYLFILLPETKNKTLVEIEEYFCKQKNKEIITNVPLIKKSVPV